MIYNIVDYGAIGDGKVLNTQAIQKAIDACSRTGGTVLVPSGCFLSGSIRLRSNVDLHLEAGAVLRVSLHEEDMIDFSKDFEDDNKDTGWEGGCFLFAAHEKNISITGEGTIDGRGREVYYDDEDDSGFHEGPEAYRGFRPRMSFLEDVAGLTVRDVTFYDSSFWTLHLAGCRDVLIENIKIENNGRGPNNDGIDPDCCRNVIIRGCIIRGGDDSIVIKTTAPMVKKYGDSRNIVVSGCTLTSRSCAIKIGTETWGDIHDIILSDCILDNCNRGIGIWTRDGGDVYNIMIHHILGNTRIFADSCRTEGIHNTWWGKGDPIFISATKRSDVARLPGKIHDITIDHVDMTSEGPVMIAGEPYSVIENVDIRDSKIRLSKQSRHTPEFFDEQPSARGFYRHEMSCAFLRNTKNVNLGIKFETDSEMAEIYKNDVVREDPKI